MSFAFIFVSAIISAGLISRSDCQRRQSESRALAVLIIVLGFLLAIPAVMKAKANEGMVRTGNTPQMEAAQKAYWPIWSPSYFSAHQRVGL